MKSTFPHLTRRGFACAALGVLAGLLAMPGLLRAQSPEEHASHHPGQAAGAMPAGATLPAATGAASAMGAMPAASVPIPT